MYAYSPSLHVIYPLSHISIYKSPPSDLIEITVDDADFFMSDHGGRKIKVGVYPFELESVADSELFSAEMSSLNAAYESEVTDISSALSRAELAGNDGAKARLKEKYTAATSDFNAKKQELFKKYGLA